MPAERAWGRCWSVRGQRSTASLSDLGKSGPCNRGGEGLRWEFKKNGGKGVLTYTRGSSKVLGCKREKHRWVGEVGLYL